MLVLNRLSMPFLSMFYFSFVGAASLHCPPGSQWQVQVGPGGGAHSHVPLALPLRGSDLSPAWVSLLAEALQPPGTAVVRILP